MDNGLVEKMVRVAKQMAKVRNTGRVNMMDKLGVVNILRELGDDNSADFIMNHEREYMELLIMSANYIGDEDVSIEKIDTNECVDNNEEWIAHLTETDPEIWSADVEGSSREEVITFGVPFAEEDGLKSFRIGRKIPVGVPTLDIDSILEGAYDQVYDEVGECAEGFLDDVTSEQEKELEEKLNDVFFNWVKKHNLEPKCYTIINDEVIKIAQDRGLLKGDL